MALLLVLTMTTISTSAQQSLPRVSYIKAIDVWAFSCLFFVCASLLEISIVNVMARKEVNKSKKDNLIATTNSESKGKKPSETDSMLAVNSENVHHEVNVKKSPICKFERIHVCSRILFPVAFGLFNTIYWWWYLSAFTIQ